jgi:hypothetical protein
MAKAGGGLIPKSLEIKGGSWGFEGGGFRLFVRD